MRFEIEDTQDNPRLYKSQKKKLVIMRNLEESKIVENMDDLNSGDVDHFFINMKRKVLDMLKKTGREMRSGPMVAL